MSLATPHADPFTADSAAAAAGAVINARGLGKTIDQRIVLRDIDMDIQEGEFVAVVGPNGAGKSTLLRLLSTLTRPSAGELTLFGRPAARDQAAIRARIGVVAHQPMLYHDLSAAENLHFFAGLYGMPDARARAAELLERLDLAHRADDPVKTFSSGMTQRLAIARSLLHRPRLLLADEPFSGLDVRSISLIEKLFAELRDDGAAIVMVNHDLAQSLRLAQRVIVLTGGTLALSAPSHRLTVEQLIREVQAA